MKTNARKLLSLLLSFLMVFGSVVTLLPTTVIAAEEDANISLTAGQKPADVSTLSYIDEDKKFLVWKDASGKLYSHTVAVSADVDLTAEYQAVDFYTPADISANGGFSLIDGFASQGLSGDLKTYDIKADGQSSHRARFDFAESKSLDDFGALRFKFTTNARGQGSGWFEFDGTAADSTAFTKAGKQSSIVWPAVATSYDLDIITSTSGVSAGSTISAFHFVPWSGKMSELTANNTHLSAYSDGVAKISYFACYQHICSQCHVKPMFFDASHWDETGLF